MTLFTENVSTVDVTDIHDSADTSVCHHTTFLWYVMQVSSNVCKRETAHDSLCVMTYRNVHSVLQVYCMSAYGSYSSTSSVSIVILKIDTRE